MAEVRVYGAKCHLCADLLGTTHDQEPLGFDIGRQPNGMRRCPRCSFCQEAALQEAIQRGGLDLFGPDVREAVLAFRAGKAHPLIDQLRAECQDIEREMAAHSEPGES